MKQKWWKAIPFFPVLTALYFSFSNCFLVVQSNYLSIMPLISSIKIIENVKSQALKILKIL